MKTNGLRGKKPAMARAAWEIRYPSKEPGFEDVKYHGAFVSGWVVGLWWPV